MLREAASRSRGGAVRGAHALGMLLQEDQRRGRGLLRRQVMLRRPGRQGRLQAPLSATTVVSQGTLGETVPSLLPLLRTVFATIVESRDI